MPPSPPPLSHNIKYRFIIVYNLSFSLFLDTTLGMILFSSSLLKICMKCLVLEQQSLASDCKVYSCIEKGRAISVWKMPRSSNPGNTYSGITNLKLADTKKKAEAL